MTDDIANERALAEIDSVIAAFYAAFDNRGSRIAATARLRALFGAEARITRLSPDGVVSWDVDEFIAPRAAMLTDGTLVEFHEWETEGRTTIAGNIASRQSRYEKSGRLNGAPYAGGGHKFIQLFRAHDRWKISAVLWEDS